MIKRFLQIVLILVSTSYFSVAQLGVRAGLNFSSMKFEVIGLNADTDSKVGVHFGLVNDLPLSDAITFRPGVLYSLKGGKSDEETISTSYIEVPLSFIYKFTKEDVGFFGELGPYLGLLMSAKNESDGDIKEGFESLDYGLNFGLGYDLGTFIVGANYGLGLANIAKTEDGDDTTAKNANVSVYGIYQF